MKKKIISMILAITMTLSCYINVFAYSDDAILVDTVSNTYTGRLDASDIMSNVNFIDVSGDNEARESIVRMASLNIVKGYSNYYYPNGLVSNEEAVAFLIRVLGMETQAQTAGINLKATMPQDSSIQTLWSVGYLQIALNRGLITNAQYAQAIAADQTTFDPAVDFVREAGVTRQQLAKWIAQVLTSMNTNSLNFNTNQQSVYQYSDWQTASPEFVSYIEQVSMAGIMAGIDGKFFPKENVTRAEMAQILDRMDSIFYSVSGIQKKTGTVGAILNTQTETTGNIDTDKSVYIRTADGNIDVVKYTASYNSSVQPQKRDAVVYSDTAIGGLGLLNEGDQIEYLVRTDENEVLYVQKTSSVSDETVQGKLVSVDAANNKITIAITEQDKKTYTLMKGIIKSDDAGLPLYIYMDKEDRLLSTLPIGSAIKLTLKNDLAIQLNYVGESELYTQVKGIVTENNPLLGYITIIDTYGDEITKNYYASDLTVEKQQYYDEMDEIGYIDSMFPYFEYDSRDTKIDSIEVGDIVYLTLNSEDSNYVTDISAVTNYVIKYGRVLQATQSSSGLSILMEYEDSQTEWLDIPNGTFITKNGYSAQMNDIISGDYIKVLVNEAIITPGNTQTTVKEVTIEGSARYITDIYRAQLLSINSAQRQLVLKNVQSLENTGWDKYQQIKNISINNNAGVAYYYNGEQITLDYALQRLKGNCDVYVATENSFGGEKAVKVTFRNNRDELLQTDNIIYANGSGTIATTNNSGIQTDKGSIVVRYGRLADPLSVSVLDYATIALNGVNSAAVVSIDKTPSTAGLIIARGRIKSIDEGKSFQVQSMAILNEMTWTYTPVQRIFTIDYDTQFYNENGWVEPQTFIDYTETTLIDKVYTIIVDGTRAVQIIENPYVKQGIRGTIYSIDGNTVMLKDTYIYDTKKGTWNLYSNKNSALTITIPNNYIIAKNDETVGLSQLQVGNQIRVMTDVIPDDLNQESELIGYMTFIEK